MANSASEYTKLSIHNHLDGGAADCTLDKSVATIAPFDLTSGYEKLLEAQQSGIGLLAQTSSNNLDAAAYLLMRKRAQLLGIELLPGAELNLLNWNDEQRVLHTVVVFSPSSNVFEIQEDLRAFARENGKFYLKIEQFCELVCGRRAIISFHGVKQEKRSVVDNATMAKDVIGFNRFFPVAIENNRSYHKTTLVHKLKDYITEQQFEWIDKKAAILSTADRTAFSDIVSPTSIWAGNSFDDLYYCVLAGAGRVVREEDIVNRVSFVSRIMIDQGAGMLASEIECSQGLNCIIGPSGSGKTLLLDIIKNKLKGAT